MQHKSNKIFSELSIFFKNNDNSDTIFSVSRVMDALSFDTSWINDKTNSFVATLWSHHAA